MENSQANISAPEPQQTLILEATESDEMLGRIGTVVRSLRESMKAMGLDRAVERAAEMIPDARDRLTYISTMTEQAAERALNAVDRAQPIQDGLNQQSRDLAERWAHWSATQIEYEEVKSLVLETRVFLEDIPEQTRETNKELLEITMAQDFQDLTGQVIKKLMEVVIDVEHQLLDLLVDGLYPEQDRDEVRRRIYSQFQEADSESKDGSLLNGPQIDPAGDEVVSGQDQVDDLLDQLGL
ncbi:protein phosphatase CheZ [Halioglobus japonicus]|uniref:Protein phosphatase CheZ n=1 Tax=Halioglobus japonicus TaxID=930805 RepID=A0AAP8ME12_9GAMM|nr:protein phosphatase CheZ [Halioglobus japonicus]AQA18114.1 protein phosphatase CheZ [Halioglobus japonicus]PLW86108.1 protein phosphatase CheZ [Halioglobus japonicus]GHD14437.1 protein phosphatase CheZ [Halioglobus japonicus]